MLAYPEMPVRTIATYRREWDLGCSVAGQRDAGHLHGGRMVVWSLSIFTRDIFALAACGGRIGWGQAPGPREQGTRLSHEQPTSLSLFPRRGARVGTG
jgi:hypothetical protein